MRVGRYCIIDYDEHRIQQLKAMARHIYSVGEYDGEMVVYELEHNPKPKKVMVTDMRIALTSAQDRMKWKTIERDMLFIKDKTIA